MTGRNEIASWFDRGVADGFTHMIVVCDTYDHEDYPVFAKGDADCLKEYNGHNGVNMQRVMEVYDLRIDKESQMSEYRAMHLPGSKGF